MVLVRCVSKRIHTSPRRSVKANVSYFRVLGVHLQLLLVCATAQSHGLDNTAPDQHSAWCVMAGLCVTGQLMAAGGRLGPPLPSWPPSLKDDEQGMGLGRRRRRMWSGAMALSMAIWCLLLIVTPVGGAATVAAAGAAEAGACTTDSCPAPPSPANSTPPAR